jgi:hypothetical protein
MRRKDAVKGVQGDARASEVEVGLLALRSHPENPALRDAS